MRLIDPQKFIPFCVGREIEACSRIGIEVLIFRFRRQREVNREAVASLIQRAMGLGKHRSFQTALDVSGQRQDLTA